MFLTQTGGPLARENKIGYPGAPEIGQIRKQYLKLVKNRSRQLSWEAEPPKIAVGIYCLLILGIVS